MIVSRKKLFNLFGGKCAYCGRPLNRHTFQRDHKEPIIRFRNVKWTFSGRNGCRYPERHCLDNIVPACRDCNQSKSNYDLETWRAGLKWPGWKNGIVFYFEKYNKEIPK